MRESPAVRVMELLRDRGVEIEYSDYQVPVFPKMREHHFDLSSVELTDDQIAKYDCVVVLTDHSDFPYQRILSQAKLIVDTRGRYREPHAKVVKA